MVTNFHDMHIENFMSFETADIKFGNAGFTIIQGRNENPKDTSLSNGSGKSSIWEALCWVLTGDTIRGCKNIQNIYTDSKGVLVEVTFSIDGHEYRLIRSKDHPQFKTNLQIFVDGVDNSGKGIREGEEILEKLLPDLTPDLIGSVIILGQNLPCKLSSRSPSGRKELLEKLTHSDFMIEDVKDRLSKRKQSLSEQLAALKARISTLSATIEDCTYELNKCTENSNTEELDSWRLILETLNVEKSTLQSSYKDIECQEKSLFNTFMLCGDKRATLSSQCSNAVSDVESEYSDVVLLYQKVAILQADKERLTRELSGIGELYGVCPVCGKPFSDDPVHSVERRSNIEDNIAEIQSSISAIQEDINKRQRDKEEKINSITAEYDKLLEDIDAERFSLNSSLEKIGQNKNLLNEKIKENTQKTTELNVKILSREEILKTLSERVLSLQNKIDASKKEATEALEKASVLSNRLDIVNKMITLSTRDFRGYIISDIVEYVENIMRLYGKKVFGDSDIEFKINGNALDISYNGKLYESLSGGERQKIDIILQLALRNMLSNISGFSSNILVLDEIFDALDVISCQKIIDFISTELSDVDCIYIITHHTDLQIPYDNIINVVKSSDNISRIY